MPGGKIVLKDAQIIVNGTDLSNRGSQITMDLPDDEVDLSTFQGDYKEFGKGLSDATWTVNFFQDFDANKVDAVLWPLKVADTVFLVKVKADSTQNTSATNPEWWMWSRLFNYAPLGGAVGEAVQNEVNFRNASQSGVTKFTT